MDFFVTGLPRSKTAWFSVYLCQGDCSCYHERLAQVGLPGMLSHQRERPFLVGDSDSGLLMVWEQLVRRFPNSPWIHIIRDVEDAKRSSLEYGIPEQNFLFAVEQQERFRETMEGSSKYLEIPFDFTEGDLFDVCSFLQIPYNQEHTSRILKFNIQMSQQEKERLLKQLMP